MNENSMKKYSVKLVIVLVLLLVAAAMVVMSTYAWMTLSSSPALEGIQVAIAGGDTILIAPNCSEITDDGKTTHYPGEFSAHLDFASDDRYEYLNSIGGLVPVSTGDGIHWYYPLYNGADGTTKTARIGGFGEDAALIYANQAAENTRDIAKGHYIYLDFWVVSPVSNYTLRVSTEPGTSNTYALSVPEPSEDGSGGYTLKRENEYTAASLRIGFLTNTDRSSNLAMYRYMNSAYYSSSYSALKGIFAEPGETPYQNYRFTIFEPNGDLHPGRSELNGCYVTTYPVFDTRGNGHDIADRLTVQLKSQWKDSLFQSFEAIRQRENSLDKIKSTFSSSLGNQLSNFVSSGAFVEKTSMLYALADAGGVVSAENLAGSMKTAGATEDVSIVELERNIPQKIRMFLWLEGQDIDCVNSVGGAPISINIELAGSSS